MAEPWEAERTVAVEVALDLVAEQFPEFRGARARLLGNGWDNTAVLVGDVVFRFPRRPATVALLETEASALPLLAPRLPLPVPVPEWHGQPSERFPWPFLGHRRLPGEPLSERPLPPAREAEAAATLGRFLAVLHGLDAGALALPADPIDRLRLEPRLPLLRARLDGLVAGGVIAAAGPWLALFEGPIPAPAPAPLPAPIHGDLYARHVLADPAGHLCGVIDWGDLHAGHPAADLAVLWGLLAPGGRAAFLSAYGPVDEATLRLARLRAAFHAVAVTAYARAVEDGTLLRAGRTALSHVLEE